VVADQSHFGSPASVSVALRRFVAEEQFVEPAQTFADCVHAAAWPGDVVDLLGLEGVVAVAVVDVVVADAAVAAVEASVVALNHFVLSSGRIGLD
jgi:hypothetical protein